MVAVCFFFFKQKTAYELLISDWSSDVCSSDLWRAKKPPSFSKRSMASGPKRHCFDLWSRETCSAMIAQRSVCPQASQGVIFRFSLLQLRCATTLFAALSSNERE